MIYLYNVLKGFEPLLALLDSQYAIIQDLALSTLLNCSYEGQFTFDF